MINFGLAEFVQTIFLSGGRPTIAFWQKFDPHQVLGIKPGASADEIGEAYRRLVKKYHPDRGGDDWAFWVVQRAHEILNDESDSRAEVRLNSESGRVPIRSDHRSSTNSKASAADRFSSTQSDWRAAVWRFGDLTARLNRNKKRAGFRWSIRLMVWAIVAVLTALTLMMRFFVLA